MNIIPWRSRQRLPLTREISPISDLAGFRREMERVFDRFFREPPWSSEHELAPGIEDWSPSVNVSETDHEILVRAELPGVDPKDVEVKLAGNMLTICGEKREEHEEKEEDAYFCERSFGSFRRTIELPATADLEAIDAEQRHGILTVRVKKQKAAEARRISIKPKEKEKETRGARHEASATKS